MSPRYGLESIKHWNNLCYEVGDEGLLFRRKMTTHKKTLLILCFGCGLLSCPELCVLLDPLLVDS